MSVLKAVHLLYALNQYLLKKEAGVPRLRLQKKLVITQPLYLPRRRAQQQTRNE